MDNAWVTDFETTSRNALSCDWFVSPLEYCWPDGKQTFDKMFSAPSSPSPMLDKLFSPELYKMAMKVDFRAKMMVYAYMRQPIAKSYGVEIENGLLSLYQLDFLSCVSQWIYVIEGYCRKLFAVASNSNVKSSGWTVPTTGHSVRDRLIKASSDALGIYLDGVLFKKVTDFHIERLSRHLLLHGNAENKGIFSQKNCLLLLFMIDALVVIEMVRSGAFPAVFNDLPGEAERINRRKALYTSQLEHVFVDANLLKIDVLKEHL